MKSIFFLFLILVTSSQIVQIYPDSSYNFTEASSRACFAGCQFCQIMTGFCEECQSPYFQKDVNGKCVVVPGYNIQSTAQQLLSGPTFSPSNVSWSNSRLTNCKPDAKYFTQSLKILGPYSSSDGSITYIRSVSSHVYMQLQFFILKMNWRPTDSLTIIITNQDNDLLANQTLFYQPTVPKQQLCSSNVTDQRYQVNFMLQNNGTTSVFLSFTPKFISTDSKWGLSTFLILTGNCHSSCNKCSFSQQPQSCTGCNNFFIQDSSNLCSLCPDGFNKTLVNGVSSCVKCPIQYQSCQSNNKVCFYKDIKNQIGDLCKWKTSNDYVSQYLVNTDQFSGSLFSVNGASQTYQCGMYSIAGLANSGQLITRIFTILPAHQSISITFNFFIVDQLAAQKNSFQIYIDNVREQTLFINTQGVSSICGGQANEVFQTYPATPFYNHNKTVGTNITIRSSNTNSWGIRNFRLSLQVCDSSCILCGQNGCTICSQYYALQNLICNQCPKGSSPAAFLNYTCFTCGDKCLQCNVTQDKNNNISVSCLTCQQGYFVYLGSCEILPNVGSTIFKNDATWKSPNPINLTSQCVLNFTYQPISKNKIVNFTVATDSLNNTYTVNQPHYALLISFYLLKIDNWSPNDEIDFYVNDLLVLNKTYADFGNLICFTNNQSDMVTYQQIHYVDDNQTITAYFQVIKADNKTKRQFGISGFQINPVACKQCLTYDFQYKVNYNYDKFLTVQVSFNRLYINNDPALFQTIFLLQVNGKNIPYDIIFNDSIRYLLQSTPTSQVLIQNVTVFCQYPQKVTTDTTNQVNQNAFFQGRIMQTSQINQLKSLSNNVATALVGRFTPISQSAGSDGLTTFFKVITRMIVYLGFASFFIGCLTPCTHFMHNIQKIWVHIYVAALTVPSILRYCLTGFRQCQDQNITIHPTQWQNGIPSYLYYDAPAFYQQYYHDITFFRNIYNVGFAAAIYLLFFVVMFAIFKLNIVSRIQNSRIVKHFKITFFRRPYFVLNSVIFYQYFTVCLACTLQFIDLKTSTNVPTFSDINAAACIIAFILATAYPIFHFLYLTHKQNDMYSIDYEIVYRNRYHQIFYRFLPKNLWKVPNYEFKPIRFKHRFYNLLRFGELWWISFIVSLMYGSPFAQVFLLLITNFLHLVFIWFSSISNTGVFKLLKVLELLFYCGLEILLLVTLQQYNTLTKDAFNTLGIVGIVFICIILVLSFIRFLYTANKIFKQYKSSEQNAEIFDKNKQINRYDERMRNDDFYESFSNNNQKVRSQQ